MARSVTVALKAAVGQYKRGMGEAERVTSKTTASVKGLGDEAGRTGEDLDELARHAEKLDGQIKNVEKDITALSKAFANTGDPKFFAQIAERRRMLGQLRNVQKYLPTPQEQEQAGGNWARRISASFGANLRLLMPAAANPAAIATGAGVAAVLAPVLASAVSGALVAGAAAGVAGLGVAIASQDQRVQAAAKSIGARIRAALEDAALPFVDASMDGLALLEQGFYRMSLNIENMLGNASRYLRPLAEGVTGFLEPVVRGLDKMVAKAGPVIEVIRQGLARVGDAIEDMFTSLEDNGAEAALGLAMVFATVEGVIRGVSVVINALTETFGFLVDMAAKFGVLSDDAAAGLEDLRNATDGSGSSAQGATSGFSAFKRVIEGTGTAAAVAETKFVALNEQIAASAGRNLSAAEASIRLREATKAAGDAVDKKRRVSDGESTALIAMARAANTTTAALDEQGRTVGAATKAHEANRKKLIETAVRMGHTKAAAERLADQYLATPKNVNTRIGQPGMPVAKKEIKEYDKQLDSLARRIDTSIKVTGDRAAMGKLDKLLIQQHALKKGISIPAASSAFRKNAYGYAQGGWTGPGPKHREAGVVHADEFVVTKEARRNVERQAPGFLDAMNERRGMPGYASGGLVAPFPVNAAVTRIPSHREAMSAVTPAAPSGGATAPFMVRVLRQAFPGLAILSTYRPGSRTLSGNPSYHGMNRAVDTAPSEAAARFMYGNYKGRLKESITPWQEWNVHNGRDRRWSGAVWQQHNFAGGNAHNHFAMAGGGVIGEPVFGVGRSGATYSFAERGPERVLSTAQTMAGGVTNHVTVNAGYVVTERQLEDKIAETVDRLTRRGRV